MLPEHFAFVLCFFLVKEVLKKTQNIKRKEEEENKLGRHTLVLVRLISMKSLI